MTFGLGEVAQRTESASRIRDARLDEQFIHAYLSTYLYRGPLSTMGALTGSCDETQRSAHALKSVFVAEYVSETAQFLLKISEQHMPPKWVSGRARLPESERMKIIVLGSSTIATRKRCRQESSQPRWLRERGQFASQVSQKLESPCFRKRMSSLE